MNFLRTCANSLPIALFLVRCQRIRSVVAEDFLFVVKVGFFGLNFEAFSLIRIRFFHLFVFFVVASPHIVVLCFGSSSFLFSFYPIGSCSTLPLFLFLEIKEVLFSGFVWQFFGYVKNSVARGMEKQSLFFFFVFISSCKYSKFRIL